MKIRYYATIRRQYAFLNSQVLHADSGNGGIAFDFISAGDGAKSRDQGKNY
jgi:hypothetical protein